MDKVTHNVRELEGEDRRAIERLVGQCLTERQQVTISISVRELDSGDTHENAPPGSVPSWWNIYEGLADEDIDRLDQAIRQRANLMRSLR